MSVQALTWAFAQEPDDMGCKFVLVAIANESGQDGVTYRGQKGLAELCSCSDRTIRAHMATLERQGLIARARRTRANGSRSSDWIVLAPGLERPPMADPNPDDYHTDIPLQLALGDHRKILPPEDSATGRIRVDNRKKTTPPPEPSVEPSDTPPVVLPAEELAVWLDHHTHTTGRQPPRERTKARAAVEASFVARRAEGYELEDLKLATVGAMSDNWRREHGYVTCESVLRPTKIHDLIERGRGAGKKIAAAAAYRDEWDRRQEQHKCRECGTPIPQGYGAFCEPCDEKRLAPAGEAA